MRKISAGVIIVLFFLLAFSPGAEAGVRKGPYLIYSGDPTQMTVLWQLDAYQSCIIRWGLNTDYSSGTADVTQYGDVQYEYTITGLVPDTLYYYQVDGVGSGSFRAAPDGSAASAKLLAYGDPQGDAQGHDTTCAVMIDRFTSDPSFQTLNICAGDWSDENDETVWAAQYFTRAYEDVPYFLAHIPVAGPRGNHKGTGTVFKKYWPYPYVSDFYWSFDYGPVHVTVVDQYVSYAPGSPQYNWLVNDLSTTSKPWKILTFHEPGWSAGGIQGNDQEVQQYIQSLCVQYGVDLLISGHHHYYARAVVDAVQHLTTGGASDSISAPIGGDYIVAMEGSSHYLEIDIQGQEASVTARRRDGSAIETFTISHGPSVRITSPQNNSTLSAGQATNVQARVLPAGGTCTAVRFYADGQLIGTDLTEPYAVSWVPTLTFSPVSLTAEADISYAGPTQTITSVPVSVNVTEAPQPQSFSVRVSASTDDAEEFISIGWVYLNSSDLELIHDSKDQIVGMRFNSIPIPPGATILEAHVQFTVKDVSTVSCSLVIRGQAADNAATFSSTYYDISRRPLTSAAVSWIPASWPTVGVAGQDQRTPDLSAILQEIINRSGWQLGAYRLGFREENSRGIRPVAEPGAATRGHVFGAAVNAGPDQTITLPNSANLSGTATEPHYRIFWLRLQSSVGRLEWNICRGKRLRTCKNKKNLV